MNIDDGLFTNVRKLPDDVYKEIRRSLDYIPPHMGLVWFLSRETLREITRNIPSNLLTIDFHFPDLRYHLINKTFQEVCNLIDYNLPKKYNIKMDDQRHSMQILYDNRLVADIRLLILNGRKLQYPDIGPWISVLPHWCMNLYIEKWANTEWYIPNNKSTFVSCIYTVR